MTKSQVAELLAESVETQVTVVFPKENVLPDWWLQEILANLSTASVALTKNATAVSFVPLVTRTNLSAGHLMFGASPSGQYSKNRNHCQN